MKNRIKRNIKLESYADLEKKAAKLEESLRKVTKELKKLDKYDNITFNEFLYFASKEPEIIFRDIFMYFHDMINYYVPEGKDDFTVTDDSIGFVNYDFNKLFVENCDDPFFADRLFANRFMNLVSALSKGVQNNQIILFEGPPGSGKSTFLNNLLNKAENYSNTENGIFYKSLWRLNIKQFKKLNRILDQETEDSVRYKNLIDVPCPNNDNPILQIPLEHREKFLNELITNKKLKAKIFNDKEYKWVFKEKACSICNSIYNILLSELNDPVEVLNMLYAKRFKYNRQFGRGVSVYNPGDDIIKGHLTDRTIQKQLNLLFQNEEVKFIFSPLAYTNGGIYALMDIKDNNIKRLNNLHGIISDGVHKVEHVEERIKSLFLGLVNPEDKKHYDNVKSFQDRIIHVNIPYILDYDAEVSVYKNKFDAELEKLFLPDVLNNFAKVIISTRLNKESPTIKNWIKNSSKYNKYIDKGFLLLKMDLYKGFVPKWLKEEDVKNFSKEIRKNIIAESEDEGKKGFSGRYSLSIFNKLVSRYNESDKLITMDNIKAFFTENDKLNKEIPEGFLNSIIDLYDFNLLQQIKESLYFFSEKQISKDIINYLFALNYDIGNTVKNFYTGDKIEIEEDLFKNFEATILGVDSTEQQRKEFRNRAQKEYITISLASEIKLHGKDIKETSQYKKLFDKYTRNIKENALAPYINNETFRRAVKEYKTEAYEKHSTKLKTDINRLISRLIKNYGYCETGAKQVIVYAFDKKIHEKFDS